MVTCPGQRTMEATRIETASLRSSLGLARDDDDDDKFYYVYQMSSVARESYVVKLVIYVS